MIDHETVAFEWYPPSWFDRESGASEGWYSLCPACMEYVVHTRPGGGWVPCGPGDLSGFDCSRCGRPLE